MNLKEWEKLSKEEQQVYWDKAKDNPDGLEAQELRSIAHELDKGFSSREYPLTTCCGIRQDLLNGVGDELVGSKKYQGIADRIGGLPGNNIMLTELVEEMAREELKHYFIINGIAGDLNRICDCEEK